jgi:hypothetical protein
LDRSGLSCARGARYNEYVELGHTSCIDRVTRRSLTPWFSCKHASTVAAQPHPKSACLLQR